MCRNCEGGKNMKWLIKLPEKVIQNCLLTWERNDGSRYVTLNAIVPDEDRKGIVAYMPIKHFLKDNTGWKSEFMGDDLPSENKHYLCCDDKSFCVYMHWFNAKKCTFGGSDKMIAFMDIPKPYMGKTKLNLNS